MACKVPGICSNLKGRPARYFMMNPAIMRPFHEPLDFHPQGFDHFLVTCIPRGSSSSHWITLLSLMGSDYFTMSVSLTPMATLALDLRSVSSFLSFVSWPPYSAQFKRLTFLHCIYLNSLTWRVYHFTAFRRAVFFFFLFFPFLH